VDDGIINFCPRKRGGKEIEQSRAELRAENQAKPETEQSDLIREK
jgi:hypothetical protein